MTRVNDSRCLQQDESGATIVEFALVAPVLLVLLLGMFDVGHNLYAISVLQGSIQEAARDATIEGASVHELDAKVESAVKNIVPNAVVKFDRKAYSNFSGTRMGEDFTDLNDDGLCNDGEPFEDVNGNKTWDADRGTAGSGGARDAVLYTVGVEYPRAFPVAGLIGLPENNTLSVVTALRNQPWDQQTSSVTMENCS